MMHLRQNLPWQMKDMRVEVKLLICPLLYDKCLEFTMFPTMKTSPLTLLLHVPQWPASQTASLFTTVYHVAVLTMKTSLQFTTAPHYHWTPWVWPNQHPSTPIPWVMTSKKKKKISKQLHWKMSIGLKNLIDICASMNIHSHILDVTTNVHMAWIPDTLDLSDISDFWRCNYHLQWWGYPCSRWCVGTLKSTNYGFHKNIYITSK